MIPRDSRRFPAFPRLSRRFPALPGAARRRRFCVRPEIVDVHIGATALDPGLAAYDIGA